MPQKKQATKGLVMKEVGRCRMTRSAIKRKRQEKMKDVLFVIHDPERYSTPAVPPVDVLAELLRKRLVIEAQQKKRSEKEAFHRTVQKKYLPERDFSRLRQMNTRERENYDQMLEKSKGFNVGEIRKDIFMGRKIRTVWIEKSSEPPLQDYEKSVTLQKYEKSATLGLADYNANNKETEYKFVKLIRANMGWAGSSVVRYVTFQAKEVNMPDSPCQNFQAKVRKLCGRGGEIVHFCNLEPKSE